MGDKSSVVGAGHYVICTANGSRLTYFDGELYSEEPYWDVPAKVVDLDAPVYEMISREMIHDDYGRGEPIEDFIANIRGEAAKADADCPVFVRYDREGDYEGGDYYYLTIGYERPPTDEERADRETTNRRVAERDAAIAEQAALAEREQFERLKAKFASDSD